MYTELIKGGRNIQHSMLAFHKEVLRNKIFYWEYYQYLCYHLGHFSTFLVTDVYMEDINDIICQIFHYFMQQYHDEKFQHLC